MKIIMANKYLYPNGGAEVYFLKLGKYLEDAGNDVQYFGMQDEKNVVGNKYHSYAGNADLRSTKLKNPLEIVNSKSSAKAFAVLLDNFKPDVVHVNNINFQLTPSIFYEAKKRNIPIVMTVHDSQIACPAHRLYIEHTKKVCTMCFDGNYSHCTKNRCVQNSYLKSKLAAYESKYHHKHGSYNLVDCFICPSKFIAEVIQHGGVNPEKITIMQNFCDEKKIKNDSDDKKYVLYFGRLSVEKGISTLVNAAKKLPDVNFVFAGTGPLADEVHSAKNIEYVGFKTGDELDRLIAGAAFSVYPSECYENCPLSVIESLQLGTPVVGSEIGGIPELLDNGITGLTFEYGNEKEMVCAISKLWNDNSLIEKMSENCYNKTYYTASNYCGDLVSLYEKIISKRAVK